MRKSAAPREIPPPLELECLKMLWQLGEARVKDVREALAPRRALAYTTVMTILDRLVRRGGVTRRKAGRAFIYSAAVPRENLRRAAVRELIDSFFDGSEQALLAYLRPGGVEAAPVPYLEIEPVRDDRLDTALL